MRKISVQTGGIFDLYGVEEGMRQIGRAGFDCVDLGLSAYLPGRKIHKGQTEGEFTLPEKEFIHQVIEPIRDAGVKYGVGFGQAHAPYSSWTPFSEEMNEFLMRAFELCLTACQELECPCLVIHPVCMHYECRLDPDREHALNMERYARLIPAAKRTGVKILLENMFTSYHEKIIEASCADMHEACGYIDDLNAIAGEEVFGFCYDSGHAALLGKDQGIALHTLGSRLLALHLHDNDGVHDHHRFPYYGVVDWEMLIRSLREIGYTGTINFETAGELEAHDPALVPKLLELLAETGRLFVSKIDQV